MKKILYLILFMFLAAAPGSAEVSTETIMDWGTGSYQDVAVSGDFVFCAADAAGLDILDIQNPSQPIFRANCRLQHRASSLFLLGEHAYITGENHDNNNYSFTIVNISAKNHPKICGSIDDFGYIGEVVVVGDYAYIGTYGTLTIVDISDPSQPQKVSSCNLGIAPMWLAIQGDYAFMANIFQGLQIIDISDPAAPVLIATNDALARLNDIALYGNFAFVSSETEGLGIFDISNPEDPHLVGEYSVAGGAKAVAVADNGTDNGINGIDILLTDNHNTLYTFAISDPTNPEIISTFETAETGRGIACRNHLAFIAEGLSGLETIDRSQRLDPQKISHYDFSGDLKSVAFSDSHAYLGDNDGIQIVNITVLINSSSSTSTAIKTGFIETEGRVTALFIKENYLYCVGAQFFGLKIVDISDPETPLTVSTVNPEDIGNNPFNTIYVSGAYAYITSHRQAKVFIYDISDPANPFLASECDCPEAAQDLTIENSYALVADGGGGLAVIDISDPLHPALIGNSSNGVLYAVKIAAQGNFVYVGNSFDRDRDTFSKITIFDISDPTQPRKVTDLSCDCGRIHNLFIKNDHLHAASDKGVKIFSLASRLQPLELTTIASTYKVYDGYGLKNQIGVVTGESGKFILFDVKDDAISDTTAPETVTRLTALGQGFASIKLSWQAANDNEGGSGVAGYRIFRNDYSTEFPCATANAPKTWFVDSSCAPDTVYSYSIKTFDRSDNSSPSSSMMTITTKALSSDDKAPTAPVGLRYAATREQVVLNWMQSFDDDSGVEFYELYKTRINNNHPSGNTLPQKLTSLFTSYTDTKVIARAEYEYQIRAVDHAGNPSPLTSITVKIPENPANQQYSYFFPHFCNDEEWDTIFSITNLSGKNAEASLQLFAADGEKLLEQKLYKFRLENGFSPKAQIPSHDHIFRNKIHPETAWMRVNSDSRLALLTTLESPSYLEGQKGVAKGSCSLLFPIVESGENCWTGLALANPTTSPAQILLQAYNQAGELQAFSETFFLPANGQVAALADDFFSAGCLPEETVTIRAESTAKIVGLEFFSLPFTDMAGLSAIPLSNIDECSTSSYLYTILNRPNDDENEFTISVVNLSPKPAAITIFWQDCADITKKSESLTIPGYGKHSFSMTSSVPQSYDLGALKIISNQPAVVFQTMNATSQTKAYASAYAFSRGLAEINFTHLRVDYHDEAENNIFTITNLSRIKQNHLTLELFQGDGELLMTFEKTIPAGSTCTWKLRDLAGFNYRNLSHRDSWLQIRADLPINGFYSYESADREKLIIISAE